MKLAVIGDIHGFWDDHDTAFFNGSGYDGLLFIGDFPRFTGGLPIARKLSQLTLPAWAIPGNHDAVSLVQLMAEIKNWRLARRLGCIGMARRVRQLDKALGSVRLGGFSLDTLTDDLGLLTARPHAMGSDRFYYHGYLKRQFGVGDYEASAEKLKELVNLAPRRLIVLAHNGPAGLGDTVDAPFGCDFNADLGDFGDPDLRAAIDHARETGRQVPAVLAGHMHHRNPKTRATRSTWAHDGQTLYINAARVPRIRKDGSHRHHIALAIDDTGLSAETVFVSQNGEIEERQAIGPSA